MNTPETCISIFQCRWPRRLASLAAVVLCLNVCAAQDAAVDRAPLSLDRFQRFLDDGEFGASAGFEYSALRDRTGSGVNPSNWQEAFASAFWHQPDKQTVQLEYRWYRRFDTTANQVQGFWTSGWLGDWRVRANAGAALSGDFIPKWQGGGGGTYRFTEQFLGHADVNYLRFTDVDVEQGDVGVTWLWHPKFSSDVFVFMSNDRLGSGAAGRGRPPLGSARRPSGGDIQSYMVSLDTIWDYAEGSWVRAFYSFGDEDVSDPQFSLIGENRFQSVGAEWRIRLAQRWSIQPSYRYEMHQQFDLHAVGLSLFHTF